MVNADATADVTTFSPMTVLDSLAVSDLPEEQKESLPRPSQQLKSLNQVHEPNRLNELHQVTDPTGSPAARTPRWGS
ncbi:hypothetical protein ACFU53_46670 [Streptomyces sp. NPDC057474]|uniref:hypothetical protein n=1 Tax=Streptomyces sp. NPDC057474 TaxID=3346144 RepID=UPI0036AF698B